MLKKIIMFIVATNVIASRPPEHRPTGTPTAHANNNDKGKLVRFLFFSKMFCNIQTSRQLIQLVELHPMIDCESIHQNYLFRTVSWAYNYGF